MSIVVCLSVCLSVCLYVQASIENGWTEFHETRYLSFLYDWSQHRLPFIPLFLFKRGLWGGQKTKFWNISVNICCIDLVNVGPVRQSNLATFLFYNIFCYNARFSRYSRIMLFLSPAPINWKRQNRISWNSVFKLFVWLDTT